MKDPTYKRGLRDRDASMPPEITSAHLQGSVFSISFLQGSPLSEIGGRRSKVNGSYCI